MKAAAKTAPQKTQEGWPANGPVKVEPDSPPPKGKKPPIPKDAAK